MRDQIVRLAADGSRTVAARLSGMPWSLAVTPAGTLYVIDSQGSTLNRVSVDGRLTRVRLVPPTGR